MQKLDLAKRHKKYYSAARTPEVIGIEPAEFLGSPAHLMKVGNPRADCDRLHLFEAY